MRPGPILDRQGNVLGEHQGLPSYTVGQRKGLGLSGASEPLFVVELDAAANALIVGTAAELGRSELVAHGVNWTLDAPVADGTAAHCKIRYRALPVACTLHPLTATTVEVRFAEPLRGVTPGQGAIFYDGDLCLGGGIIA
jgi:tRNA-specific 2-thiouridylase